tara:strand:+ start:7148 stop:8650 length:1503 start_codon:yes stop_codon:yes gene_type:complete
MSGERRIALREKTLNYIRPHLEHWTGTDAQFADFLYEVNYLQKGEGPAKPLSWRNTVSRFRKLYPREAPINDIFTNGKEMSLDEADATWISDEPYYYNSETDVYVTFIRSAGNKPVTVSGDVHRAMKSAYSNMVNKPSSMNQISRDFQIPRAWFDEYRRVHGWTHDMDPFTNEELKDADSVEDLVDELVLRRRRSLHITYEKKKWDEIQKDAEKWREFEDTFIEHLKIHKPEHREVQMITLQETDPYALVISPTDLHYGKYGWEDEVGERYDFDEARKRLHEATSALISRLGGTPEKIIVAAGSDWFHVDNDGGTTTAGTAQDRYGSPAQILMQGCELAKEHIDMLRSVAPVEVVFMAGNHDRHSTLALGLFLKATYESCDDCTVILDANMSRQYITYGNTLLGFTHGDGVRFNQLPSTMAKEQWENWGKCRYKVWFSGHLHHQALKEHGGAFCVQLPSLAGHDRWHHRKGFVSQAGMSAHLIDREEGMIGSMFKPVVDE